MTTYSLLPAQKQFLELDHDAEIDFTVYKGGFGSGKTWIGSYLGYLLASRYPNVSGLVGAETARLVRDTTLREYLNHLYNFDITFKRNKSENTIEFPNKSTIFFRHFDDPESVKSFTSDFIEIEEGSNVLRSLIDMLMGRLRGKNLPTRRIFAHTNPEESESWITELFSSRINLETINYKDVNGFERYYKYGKYIEKTLIDGELTQVAFRLIEAPSTQNIYLPKSQIAMMQNNYDPEYYRINVLGQDGNYSTGLVVKGFTDNNIKQLNYQDNITLYITCDFNVDPMCWVLLHQVDNKIYCFDEIVIENTTTYQAINEFIKRYPSHKGNIIINGDASGDSRHTDAERTNYVIMRNELSKVGYKSVVVKTKLGNPPIKNRIAAFNAMVQNSEGQQRLYISPNCKHLINNMKRLRYKKGTSDIDKPSTTQIKNDNKAKFLGHIFDAISYHVDYYFPIKLDREDKAS